MTLDALARCHGGRLQLSTLDRRILANAWCMPWVSQQFALVTHFQPLTRTLAVLAAWQLSLAAPCVRGTVGIPALAGTFPDQGRTGSAPRP